MARRRYRVLETMRFGEIDPFYLDQNKTIVLITIILICHALCFVNL